MFFNKTKLTWAINARLFKNSYRYMDLSYPVYYELFLSNIFSAFEKLFILVFPLAWINPAKRKIAIKILIIISILS